MNNVYAVMLNKPNDKIREHINKTHPQMYPISDTCFLIDSHLPDAVDSISTGIRESFGSDANPAEMVHLVVRLNSRYGGLNYQALWDWINKVKG